MQLRNNNDRTRARGERETYDAYSLLRRASDHRRLIYYAARSPRAKREASQLRLRALGLIHFPGDLILAPVSGICT